MPPARRHARSARRRINRGALPKSLPRIETIIDIESRSWPCCRNTLHPISEDIAERLERAGATARAGRASTQIRLSGLPGRRASAAPPRVIEGVLPTEGLVAKVRVSKYADHLPL